MTTLHTRKGFLLRAAVLLCAGALVALPSLSRAASTGALQSSLQRHRARSQVLAASVGRLASLVSSLDAQVALIRGREAAIAAQLAGDRAAVEQVQGAITRQRSIIAASIRRLRFARNALARQLRAGYESEPPDVMTVVLNSHGFGDLLDRLDFLRLAEQRQRLTITRATTAKLAAGKAAAGLDTLQARNRAAVSSAAARAAAVASIAGLLSGREAVLRSARAAQLDALHVNNSQSNRLVSDIAKVRAAQQRSAAQLKVTGSWAIPTAIVLCESGGQNLPPNSAGASGYYQFLPSTWTGLGGSTPAAYLAGRSEQDRLAARLWDGGRGASNWVCAGIVGLHR